MNICSKEILKKLVSIDTSIEISTLEAVDYIANIFENYKIKPHIIKSDINSNRASIIASIGNPDKPGIVLSGHLDTYGTQRQIQNWLTDPYELNEINNEFIGRGVVDMKGAIACSLGCLPAFIKKHNDIPVHFVFTHDEEGKFTAINQLFNNKFYNLISNKQLACIVMEPSNSNIVTAHKGYRRKEILLQTNNKFNSLKYAILIYNQIEKTFKNLKLKNNNIEDLIISNFHAGSNCLDIPNLTSFEFQYKYNVDYSDFIKRIELYLKKIVYQNNRDNLNLDISMIDKINIMPLNCSHNNKLLLNLQNNIPNIKTIEMNYGTEAGYFQKYGIETFIWGLGNYERAHRSNENVNINDFKRYQNQLKNLVINTNNNMLNNLKIGNVLSK